MAGPGLPTNTDSTYADSGTDPTVKLHQQHHDAIHGIVNRFDTAAPADGKTVVASGGSFVYADAVTSQSGVRRLWVRTAAQGFPTSGDGAVDGDVLIYDASA